MHSEHQRQRPKIRRKELVAPSIDKKIDGSKSTNDAAIGDVVNYTVTIHAKKGATGYVLTDTMTKGLTFNRDSLTVKVGATTLAENTHYTVAVDAAATDGSTKFTVTFKDTYLNTIDGDTDIVVSYTATVNQGCRDRHHRQHQHCTAEVWQQLHC